MSQPRRRLTSFALRWLLWSSTGGVCAICGVELDEANFEADHIVPYSKTHRTNVHEMQPLCRGCNRRKGDRET